MNDDITSSQLANLGIAAGLSDRGRAHLNTHDALDANVQRLFIATSPATYIRPHRHSEAHKWEFFVLIEGAIDLLIFDGDGTLIRRSKMSRKGVRAVEVPCGTWHCYVCQEPGTIALEIKEGAYIPTNEQDFAKWSPIENSAGCENFVEWMRNAATGDRPAEASMTHNSAFKETSVD